MKNKHVVAGVALAVSLLVIGATPALAMTPGKDAAAMSSQFPATLVAKPQYRLGEPIALTFGLRNATDRDYSVLVWNTPLEDLNQEVLDYVQVRHGDRVLPYDGRQMKRGEPDGSSYRLIRSGESVQEQIDLSTAFAFTEPGTYTVTLDTQLQDAVAQTGAVPSARAQFTKMDLDRATVTFQILPGGPARPTIADTLSRDRAPSKVTFDGGTPAQQKEVLQAVDDANNYVDKASAALPVTGDGSTRYTMWFGKFDDSRYGEVRDHFGLIGHDSSNATYDLKTCTKPGVFAYVYPTAFDKVYLCPQFWKAPMTGTDSKAGTLVHEQSHFNDNGGTRDYAYGQPKCKSLAVDHPATAVMNADSHEYFAENTPPL